MIGHSKTFVLNFIVSCLIGSKVQGLLIVLSSIMLGVSVHVLMW